MRTFVTILSLALTTAVYAQKDKSLHLQWYESANGNLYSTELQYSERGKFYYSFSNDRDNLYVVMKVFEKDVQKQILFSGLTIWIDMDGRKAKKTGLKFPARIQNQGKPDMMGIGNQQAPGNQQSARNDQQQGNMQGMQNPRSGAPGTDVTRRGGNMQMPSDSRIELIGLSGADRIFISSNEENNFRGSVSFEKNGNMWYQMIIPLSRLPERSEIKKNENDSFTLGFSYPGVLSQQMRGGSGGPGGERGGDMGGPGGGAGMGGPGGGGGRGGPGGRPGGGSQMGSSSVSPVLVWFKNIQFATER
jgi:hypothetical protein